MQSEQVDISSQSTVNPTNQEPEVNNHYDEDDIPQLIIENNLHGIDLDDRAVQLAQLGLYIKAKQKRRTISQTTSGI